MKLTIELTPEQLEEIAAAVAAKLAKRGTPSTVTIAQAAKMLGVVPDTIRRRIRAGIIPRVPNMGVVRIPTHAIDRLMGEPAR